jgi:hypothetical protein
VFDTIDRDKILLDLNSLRLKYLTDTRHRLSEGAIKHLHRGLLVRISMLEESVVVLDDELGRADGPLNSYLASKLTLLINAYYLNIAGSLSSVPWSGVNPPAPHAGLASMGGASQASGSGWCCKRWAGPFPWFESYLNQTNHAQDPLCRT